MPRAPTAKPRRRRGWLAAALSGSRSGTVGVPHSPNPLSPSLPPTAGRGGWEKRAGGMRASGLLQGLDVDRALGELGQLLVRVPLLVERLLQELRRLLLAEVLGPGADATLAGHLVVLDPLR